MHFYLPLKTKVGEGIQTLLARQGKPLSPSITIEPRRLSFLNLRNDARKHPLVGYARVKKPYGGCAYWLAVPLDSERNGRSLRPPPPSCLYHQIRLPLEGQYP